MERIRITLLPIGSIECDLLDWLQPRLEAIFDRQVDCQSPIDIPEKSYDPERKQYLSTAILDKLQRQLPPWTLKLLGITNVDLFVPYLNFVFGEAYVDGKAAVISLHRLRPEFHNQPPNPDLLRERALKEAVHELGHTFGLSHCDDPRCVMRFSTDIADTDRKGPDFCPNCARVLPPVLAR